VYPQWLTAAKSHAQLSPSLGNPCRKRATGEEEEEEGAEEEEEEGEAER